MRRRGVAGDDEVGRRRRLRIILVVVGVAVLATTAAALLSDRRSDSALDQLRERLDAAYAGTDAGTLRPIVAGSTVAIWADEGPDSLFGEFFAARVGAIPVQFAELGEGTGFRAIWMDDSVLVGGCIVTDWTAAGYRSRRSDDCPRR